MIPATSTSNPALYASEHVIRLVLERLNDPSEQRESYPFLDDVLEHIDLAATDALNGWSDPETADFREPFTSAFTVLVLAESQFVYRRGEQLRELVGVSRPWRWELTGRITEWAIEPCLYLPAASGSFLAAIAAVFRSFGGLRDCRSDGDSGIRFSSANEALQWANELAGVAREHGVYVRFWLTPREEFETGQDSHGGVVARTGEGWRRSACEIRPPAVLSEFAGKEMP